MLSSKVREHTEYSITGYVARARRACADETCAERTKRVYMSGSIP